MGSRDTRTQTVQRELSSARARFEAGQAEDAAAHCRAALALDGRNADALHLLGAIALRASWPEAAAEILARATKYGHDQPRIFHTYGVALHGLRRYAEAARAFRRAISLKADYAAAHCNLGAACIEMGEPGAAVAPLLRAVALDECDVRARMNLGVALMKLDRIDEAIACYRRALELDGGHVDAHFNLGNAVRSQGRFAEAIEHYSRAIALRPAYAAAHANRAHLNLLLGRLDEGWRDYEWRIQAQAGKPYASDPDCPDRTLPRPSSLLPLPVRGKRLLVLRDQGLGDEIFFLRFAAVLQARGARVAYASHPKLATILARAPAIDELVLAGSPPGEADCVLLAGELPLIAGCASFQDIPPPLPLCADEARVRRVRSKLAAAGSGPWLGVTWRAGDPQPVPGRLKLVKEIGVAELGAAIASWPGDIAVLQRDPTPQEIATLITAAGRPVHDLSRYNDDLEEMTALLSALDDYVGVSNTNMHLYAGLGKHALVLIPDPPDWRWLDHGEASPWFPGFRLYRETVQAGWQVALAKLASELYRA